MENVLNVEPRTTSGKGNARKLRAQGMIPGVLYGHKEKPQPFTVDPKALRRHIQHSGFGRNTVLAVKGLERDVIALLKDTQVDPLKRDLVHVDLIEVREDESILADIPIELTGRPKGVVMGGLLQMVRRTVRVRCTPMSTPKEIAVDITNLDLGQSLHISELPFPEGVASAMPDKWVICAIHAPKAEAGAGAGEGEAAAAPAAK